MSERNSKEAQKLWIIEWLQRNPRTGIGATHEAFHDDFYEEFGGRRTEKLWGASPVNKAMRLIRDMWKEGILERHRFGLCDGTGCREPGFPSWTYDYTLTPYFKETPNE